MSRAFAGSPNGSFLQAAGVIVNGPPFSVSLWLSTPNIAQTGNRYLAWIGDAASSGDWWALSINAAGRLVIEARSASPSVFDQTSTGNSLVADTAQHVCGVWASSTSRWGVLNGDLDAAAISTTACSPSAPTRIAIGAARDSTPSGGVVADIGYFGVWNRALTNDEVSSLASGTHPKSIPDGLVDFYPITGADNPEKGDLAFGPSFVPTGTSPSSFEPPVSPPTTGSVATAVKPIWTSGLGPGVRYSGGTNPRQPSISFAATTVPPGTASRRIVAIIDVMPEADATSVLGVTYGGVAMTLVGSNAYGGNVNASLISAWELTNPPTSASQLTITCDKNLWCGDRCIWAFDDAGMPETALGSFDEASGASINATIATSPGALVLFMGAMQGRDGSPATLVWDGSSLNGEGATTTASTSTDLSTIVASKVVAGGTSESAQATFSTSDGRGWLMVNIPPLVAAGPAATTIAARLSVGDVDYAAAVEGQVGVAQVIRAEFDEAAGELRISIDGQPPTVVPWTGAANPTDGDLIIGAVQSAGVPQPGGNLKLLALAVSTEILTPKQIDDANAILAESFAPVTTSLIVDAFADSLAKVDVASGVKDPAGWGWRIIGVDSLTHGAIAICDEHTACLDLIGMPAGDALFRAQIESKHPLKPSSPIQVTVRARDWTLPNAIATTSKDTAVTSKNLCTTLDVDGKAMKLVELGTPEHGTVLLVDNEPKYTPTTGYTGSDSFTVLYRSKTGAERTATVFVSITATTTSPPPPPPPPATTGKVIKAYRTIGFAGYGGNQGEVHDPNGEWYRFTAATDGIVKKYLFFRQGGRANWQYNDGHSGGNFGKYKHTLHRYTGATLPTDNIGSADDREEIGATKGFYYPARPTGDAKTTFDSLLTAAGEHGTTHPQGDCRETP